MMNDIASALAEMGPFFSTFTGGNNLEGGIVDQRWQLGLYKIVSDVKVTGDTLTPSTLVASL